ncbi:MAG: DUF512 domain-containing protein [Chloroflexi bacterium]|nr:DUF512 domain-containing protein [Chloroflexota bacterium]
MPTSRRTGEIAAVDPGSLADAAGLTPGDRVLAVNGRPLRDQIDYRFQVTEDLVELTVIHDDARGFVEFEKHPDEPLGIEFSDSAFDGTTLCNNKCFFCFLKGLPKGLRKTLYVKDDDYRLSFEHGNFVTLTNLDDGDWERLEEQRLSPLNISVHATNLDLRRMMLGNPRAPDIREQLRRLHDMRIEANTQVVLCPGVNDGDALDETIAELLSHPNVLSIGIVPVGATLDAESRIDAEGMRAVSAQESRTVLRQVRRWQRRAIDVRGARSVFASDEFLLRANARIPSATAYADFPQWENGVGMVRSLLDDWRRVKARLRRGTLTTSARRHATIACGSLIAPVLQRLADEASQTADVRIDVIPIRNTLFGPRVNVSGLIPGQDFLHQLSAVPTNKLGEAVFLPRASLDYFGRRFLDDVTPETIAGAIDRPLGFAYNLSEVIEWMAGADLQQPAQPERSNGRSWATVGEPTGS